jgi:Flp pilus assembly protein TadG
MTARRFAHGARKDRQITSGQTAIRVGALARLRTLWRSEGGVTALEFAMIGPIFMLLIMGVLENGLTLWSQSMLDNATRDASRLMQTGQAQSGGTSFATQLCNDVSGLMKCSALQYRIQTGSTFAGMSSTIATGSGGTLTGFSTYPTAVSNSSAGQDTMVQVVYTRTFIVPWVGRVMTNGTSQRLVSTAVFQTEPY